MSDSQIRRSTVRAYLTGTEQRALVNARNHHVVIDGPDYAGGPNEEIHPTEAFLAGIAGCAVLMVERLAKAAEYPLKQVEAVTTATVDKTAQPREDLTLVSTLDMRFAFEGVTFDQACELVETFQQH